MTDAEALVFESLDPRGPKAWEAARQFNKEVLPVSLAWELPAPERKNDGPRD